MPSPVSPRPALSPGASYLKVTRVLPCGTEKDWTRPSRCRAIGELCPSCKPVALQPGMSATDLTTVARRPEVIETVSVAVHADELTTRTPSGPRGRGLEDARLNGRLARSFAKAAKGPIIPVATQWGAVR
jgi:hypothetical protein